MQARRQWRKIAFASATLSNHGLFHAAFAKAVANMHAKDAWKQDDGKDERSGHYARQETMFGPTAAASDEMPASPIWFQPRRNSLS